MFSGDRYARYTGAVLRLSLVFAIAIWTLFSSVAASAVLLSDLLAGATLTAGDKSFTADAFRSTLAANASAPAANQIDVSAQVSGSDTILAVRSATAQPFTLASTGPSSIELLLGFNVLVTDPTRIVDNISFSISGAQIVNGTARLVIQSALETPAGTGCNNGVGGPDCVAFSLTAIGNNGPGFFADLADPLFELEDTALNHLFSSAHINESIGFLASSAAQIQFDSYSITFHQRLATVGAVAEPDALLLLLAGLILLVYSTPFQYSRTDAQGRFGE
jgi:hypothetical protein